MADGSVPYVIHPGEIPLESAGSPQLSWNKLVHALGVPARRINEIVHGKRAITAVTSQRLGRYFDNSPRS